MLLYRKDSCVETEREVKQILESVFPNHVIILQPDSALKRVRIDARLQRDDIAHLEDVVRSGDDARRFVSMVANTVAGVMPEALLPFRACVERFLDGAVDVPGGNAGANQILREILGVDHGLPGMHLQFRGGTDGERA